MRWIRGLVPTVVILLCALVFGFICYVSIWGVPSFVVVRVEQALLEKGVPVNIGTLKVSIWPRAVVTLKDVEMLDPEAIPQPAPAVPDTSPAAVVPAREDRRPIRLRPAHRSLPVGLAPA